METIKYDRFAKPFSTSVNGYPAEIIGTVERGSGKVLLWIYITGSQHHMALDGDQYLNLCRQPTIEEIKP